MAVRLFVGNLPYDASEDEIRAHFSAAGNVSNIFVPLDRETGKKRGFAFVEFLESAHAQEAIRLFNNQPFKGRSLAVNEARAKDSSRPSGPPSGGPSYRSGPPRAMDSGPRPFVPRPAGGMGYNRDEPGSLDAPARGDRPNRKQFGPDAKPFRNRNPRGFRPEGGKKALKEKLGGQLYSMDDDENDTSPDVQVDDFSTAESPDQDER
jgi:RNA recognition motif-containing protein